ncbi:MAG: hypothetical protein MR871_06965 [Lachnospiraceae bacterium]|nr:hypothetical protein [Lachnospiraceae bacterium]MDD7077924.1 hypothetical protein [Lachnospiraceae bacterium]
MDKLLLFVIIIILAYVCVRLFNKNKEIKAMANRMAEEIRKECEEEIKNVQRRAAADLILEREKIESDKDRLMVKSEKELLVDAVQALSVYGDKMLRLENNLDFNRILESFSSDVCSRVDDIQKKLEEIQGICSVGNSLTDIKEDLETIKNMVN